MSDVEYEAGDGIARLTLNRPERGNGLTRRLITELERLVERADLDPDVHVLLLAGNGKGFCGGYDLVEYGEGQIPNHDPTEPWDPMLDHAMMIRNVRAFMSLFECSKPVVCKVHGFCVAGGTDPARRRWSGGWRSRRRRPSSSTSALRRWSRGSRASRSTSCR
jgi:enoyl-CoA hydratase